MPYWEPAKISGLPIDSYAYFILPFTKSVNTLISLDFHYRVSSITKPEIPGGQEVFHKWVKKNLNYPEKCRKEGITCTVTVQFFADKDGAIGGAKVVDGIKDVNRFPDCCLAKEALRLASSMPK